MFCAPSTRPSIKCLLCSDSSCVATLYLTLSILSCLTHPGPISMQALRLLACLKSGGPQTGNVVLHAQGLPAWWRSNAGGLATTCRLQLSAQQDTQGAQAPPESARLHVKQSSSSNQLRLQQQLIQSTTNGSSQLRQHCCWLRRSEGHPWQTSGQCFSTSQMAAQDSKQQQRMEDTGWTRDAVYNWANALSMGRLLSGPAIAYMIMHGMWAPAVGTLAVAGVSDWADGYVAKQYGQQSVLGSYLDPLADKVLIGCLVAALTYEEHLSLSVTMIIVGRDVFLVSASLLHRLRAFGWRWPGWAEFLRVQDSSKGPSADKVPQHGQQEASSPQPSCDTAAAAPQPASDAARRPPAAAIVKPLYISKVNTCLQFVLIGSCLTHPWLDVPSAEIVSALGMLTASTTVVSGAAYVRSYLKGNFQ